jgi:hypothetical protein
MKIYLTRRKHEVRSIIPSQKSAELDEFEIGAAFRMPVLVTA